MLPALVNWSESAPDMQTALLQRPAVGRSPEIRVRVTDIVAAVRSDGDDALRSFTREFDGVELSEIRVSDEELAGAIDRMSADALAAIDLAIKNVRAFHERQQPESYVLETMPGVRCERRSLPIDAVGLYVPAGTAPLPSAAIMLAVPAEIAGCPTRVL